MHYIAYGGGGELISGLLLMFNLIVFVYFFYLLALSKYVTSLLCVPLALPPSLLPHLTPPAFLSLSWILLPVTLCWNVWQSTREEVEQAVPLPYASRCHAPQIQVSPRGVQTQPHTSHELWLSALRCLECGAASAPATRRSPCPL